LAEQVSHDADHGVVVIHDQNRHRHRNGHSASLSHRRRLLFRGRRHTAGPGCDGPAVRRLRLLVRRVVRSQIAKT
jgi:hypothetical protein